MTAHGSVRTWDATAMLCPTPVGFRPIADFPGAIQMLRTGSSAGAAAVPKSGSWDGRPDRPEAVWKGVFGERGPGFVDVLPSKRVRQLRYQVRIAWSRPGTPRMEITRLRL